jgi:plastocyanin
MRKTTYVWILALGMAAGCGGGGGSNPMEPSGGGGGGNNLTATVAIDGDAYRPGGSANFAPAAITVQAGTLVTWTNNDQTAHTATENNGQFNSGSIGGGGTFSRQFNTVGSFEYHCTLHANMSGTVTVR